MTWDDIVPAGQERRIALLDAYNRSVEAVCEEAKKPKEIAAPTSASAREDHGGPTPKMSDQSDLQIIDPTPKGKVGWLPQVFSSMELFSREYSEIDYVDSPICRGRRVLTPTETQPSRSRRAV